MTIKLAIFPGYFLPHIGGLETHVDEFAKYLSKKEYQITIFAPNIPKSKAQETIHGNVNIIRYPAFEITNTYPLPKFWKRTYWQQRKKLKRSSPDIVMTRTRFFYNAHIGYRFAKKNKLPLIHVEHGSDYVKTGNWVVNKIAYCYDKTIAKKVVQRADKVVAISAAVNDFLKRAFKRDDAPIITRGVDFDMYDRIAPNKNIRKHYGDQVIISVVCRLTKWKGVENTIKAFQSLPDKTRKRAVLLIAGYGEEEQALRNLAGDDMRIRFMGKATFKDAVRLYKTSDLFVHSSYPGGGLSNSLLQAMYCSCAVIASPHEGAREVVNSKNGILLKDNSPTTIKRAMANLIDNKKERESLGKEAKRYIKRHFDWNKIIEAYDKVCEQMLK